MEPTAPPLGKARKARVRRLARRDSLWKKIVDGGLDEWLYYQIDIEGKTYVEIQAALAEKGITATPALIYMCARRRRFDFENRRAVRELVEPAIEGNVGERMTYLLRRRLQTIVVLHKMSAGEVIEALKMELRLRRVHP